MGWFGGVCTPEQCSLVGFSTDSVMAKAKHFDEGGNSMEIKNNTDTSSRISTGYIYSWWCFTLLFLYGLC